MERLLGLLTSRRTEGMIFVLIVVAATTRSHIWWLVAGSTVGIFTVAMIAVGVVGLRRTRDAWKKFPDTPEYAEYAAKRDAEFKENDKNKIELE